MRLVRSEGTKVRVVNGFEMAEAVEGIAEEGRTRLDRIKDQIADLRRECVPTSVGGWAYYGNVGDGNLCYYVI